HSESVLSPPLTPALPQQHPFDKRHSTDLGYPYRYSMDYHHWMSHPSMHQQNVMHSQPQSHQSKPVIRKEPTKTNKHMCNHPDCNWSFKRYEHLKRHMLVHTGERPYSCSHIGCGKRFSRSDNYHAHFRTHEKKTAKKLEVSIKIDNESKSPHNEMKNLPRNTEGKRASYFGSYPLLPTPSPNTISFLYEHEHTSINDQKATIKQEDQEARKPHACSYPNCEKRFRRLEHLKRHSRIHTNEQPFKCNVPGCFKTFSRSDNLTQHKKTHERRVSKYEEVPHLIHPEPFVLADFIREDNSKLSNFNWQHPGDTTSHHHHHLHHPHHHHTTTTTTTTTTTESVHC
ncbi:hypothetical protein BY458DRAFT_448271, partial [Sporodiniella umbellata]